ncbi:dTDP-4-dehydrorhamnose reductase [Candidatus Peregrinibacteria bacterium]|nr:dTDP-4-dehydrorhamnose reductase [Candidatus Peregrinibacteria bacterium]
MINSKSRYLILGKNGLLGMDMQTVLQDRDYIALSREEFDITDEGSLKEAIMNAEADVVINATAYKDVYKAEEDASLADEVNGYAVGRLAKICRDFGITLVHFSTDYVFDGENKAGYKEEDIPNPVNAYGRSKLLGEQLIQDEMEAEFGEEPEGKYFIIRTSYLFGKHGPNLISKLLDNAKKGQAFSVVSDQFAKATYTLDLVKQVKWLLESNEYESGIYHITNAGVTNWYDLAKFLLKEAGLDESIITPGKLDDWPSAAKRPRYSSLINTKLPELRDWKIAIKDYLI